MGVPVSRIYVFAHPGKEEARSRNVPILGHTKVDSAQDVADPSSRFYLFGFPTKQDSIDARDQMQKGTDLLLSKKGFSRVVREVAREFRADIRYRIGAD